MTQYVVSKGFYTNRQYFKGVTGNSIQYTSLAVAGKTFWSESEAKEKALALENVTEISHNVEEIEDEDTIS
jgi:hypothetical protein